MMKLRDSIATRLRAERTRNPASISGRRNRFTPEHNVETGSGDTKPPMWVPGAIDRGMTLTTHLHLVPRLRMVELYLHSGICLDDVVLN
jgi:hypothetical protein